MNSLELPISFMDNIVDMANRNGLTCIQLSKETKKLLDELGKKGMTYEDIIKGLILKSDPKII